MKTLTLLLAILATSTGCISSKTSNPLPEAFGEAFVMKVFAPPLELGFSTKTFQQENGRWPADYAELRSFTASNGDPALTNYDRVDFTQKPDGSVEILAVAPNVTNQMTLRLPDENQKAVSSPP